MDDGIAAAQAFEKSEDQAATVENIPSDD